MAFVNLSRRYSSHSNWFPRGLHSNNKSVFKKVLPVRHLCISRELCNNSGGSVNKVLPSSAEIVIAGGGVNGASVAYHLEKLGWKDVLVLEQGQAGCGTSWHAAGLCGTLKGTKTQVDIATYAIKLFSQFEEEGKSVGFRKCGSLDFATTKDRAINMRRTAALARECGEEVHILCAKGAVELNPLLKVDDIELALWAPNSGLLNPTDLVQVYLKEATKSGYVNFIEGCEIEEIHVSDRQQDRVTGVTTNLGHVTCDKFINCTGLWARQLGLKSNPPVRIPLHACEHFMFVTKAEKEHVDPMMPVTRDYDGFSYIREWSGGLLIGGFEPNAKATFYKGIPQKFQFQLLEEDLEHCEDLMDNLINRFPCIGNAEIRSYINGPESFTPDNLPYVSKSLEFQNYYIAAGLNSNGITNSAGVGKIMAELITYGESELDSHILDIRRITPSSNNKLFCHDKAAQTLTSVYAQSYPKMISDGESVKKTPLHYLLEKNGAVWGENANWARPQFFKLTENEKHVNSFGKPSWIKNVQSELLACINSVGILEHSSKSKFRVTFPDSASGRKFFEHSCPHNDFNELKNLSVAELFLHDSNKSLISTVSIIKTSDISFTMVTESNQHTFLMTHLQDTIRELDLNTNVEDVSGKYSLLGLIGPKTGYVLNELLSPPFTTEAIPENKYQVVDIGYASDVTLIREASREINEWKILLPTEYSQCLYSMMLKVGEKYGMQQVGSIAQDSLRVQHMKPAFGVELDTITDPNLVRDMCVSSIKDMCVSSIKDNERIQGSNLSLMQLEIIPSNVESWPWGGEPVLYEGKYIGRLSTVGYTMGDSEKALALSILDRNIVETNSLVDVQVGEDSYEGRIARIL